MKITLPPFAYHAGQQTLINEKRRFNIVSCGRRWGKTLFGLEQLLFEAGGAIDGRPVAWFAPTYKLLLDVWKDAEKSTRPIKSGSNKTENRIELVTGGLVDFWTLQDESAGRGRKYARIVVDEAAHSPYLKDVWEQAIMPTLSDYQGDAWVISTPNGFNYFHALYEKAEKHEDWGRWQMPTAVNPHIKQEEIERARKTLPERVFRQEFMAEFIADGAGVFRGIDSAPECEWLDAAVTDRAYVIGVDWGRHNDFTVAVVMDGDGRVVHVDRYTDIGYAVQVGRLRALWERFWECPILAESNSMGGPLIELLQSAGINVQGFQTTSASKNEAIESLVLAFEQRQISLPRDERLDVMRRELIAYDQERLPSGVIRYGAPIGYHDDCVMALAIAWHGVTHTTRIEFSSVGRRTIAGAIGRSSNDFGGW